MRKSSLVKLASATLALACVSCATRQYDRFAETAAKETGPQAAINKIYIHWTATYCDWAQPGHYHAVVTCGGKVQRLTPYTIGLNEHTYNRNIDSYSIAAACMEGSNGVWSEPCSSAQVDALAKEIADVAKKLGWTAADITVNKVLTHAEAASNRDFPLDQVKSLRNRGNSEGEAKAMGMPHENYGPASWSDGWPGGTSERWDFWQIKSSDKEGAGGEIIRAKVKAYMGGAAEVAKPGYGVTTAPTWLKKRMADSSTLNSDEKCQVTAGKTIGFSSSTAEGDHLKVNVTQPTPECPTWKGALYLYPLNWKITMGTDAPPKPGKAVTKQETWLKREPLDSATLPDSKKCKLDAGKTIGFSDQKTVDGGYTLVEINTPSPSCPAFTGKVYLYSLHFNIKND